MAIAAGLLASIGASSRTRALLVVVGMCAMIPVLSVLVLSMRVRESVAFSWFESSVAGAAITIGLFVIFPGARVLQKRVALTCGASAAAAALFVSGIAAVVSR